MLLGINTLNHDASLALIEGREIKFAAHSERYSRVKNDPLLNTDIVQDMLKYGKPSRIVCATRPLYEASRRLYSGERPLFNRMQRHLDSVGLGGIPVSYVGHHRAHAAMGYHTSGFSDALILVMDAVGEWNCTSIWKGDGHQIEQVMTVDYPDSMGLFYSAVTQAVGLKPNEEEYILMGMAAFGKPQYADQMIEDLFEQFDPPYLQLRHNLHKGLGSYLKDKNWIDDMAVAASAQEIAERYIKGCAFWAKRELKTRNLVLVGGCALNCVANSKIRDKGWFNDIWVPPNPGDAGLSIGAAVAYSNGPVDMNTAYLGYDIVRKLDAGALISALVRGEIVGLANGRAEFGPRALGNRSILADPRGPAIKDSVNAIKRRQEFRPFAPVILEEHAKDYFANVKHDQRFMQWTNECLFPEEYPAIIHVDGTSRIQLVHKDNSTIRYLLEEWKFRTGCPMLLNTSLNIKGEPLVNTWEDAERFSEINNIKVY